MKIFLTTILPDRGGYFVAAKTDKGFVHHPCDTVDEMVSKALQFDAQCLDP